MQLICNKRGQRMSVSVSANDPDVDIECDECGESIEEGTPIYCQACSGRKQEEITQCSKCKHTFARSEMFSKIVGLLCHKCAFLYEAEAAGMLPKGKAATC